MSFGPNPWQQTNWDWRAAANFMAGGAGAGLVVMAVLAVAHPALLVFGLVLIGAGLACVWMEIGRPLRALHVFFNPQTSWMTREGMVAALLMPVALASLLFWPQLGDIAALLALAFVWCQGRILRAAKGIPAWREPRIVPFIVITGLAEGGGLLMLLAPGSAAARSWVFGLVAALVLLRLVLWAAYRKRLGGRARTALAGAERALLWGGTLAPLALMALVAAAAMPGVLLAAAGLLATAAGAWIKFVLVTRAGFNQGFALAQLPVRGVRRS
jgi:phenylacetyl-CoA:acceptor oxidoreductase 26-kDa subunit